MAAAAPAESSFFRDMLQSHGTRVSSSVFSGRKEQLCLIGFRTLSMTKATDTKGGGMTAAARCRAFYLYIVDTSSPLCSSEGWSWAVRHLSRRARSRRCDSRAGGPADEKHQCKNGKTALCTLLVQAAGH